MTHRLLLCALLLCCIGATTIPSRPPAHGVRDTVTVSELQPANLRKDQCYIVTDGTTNTDCTSGGAALLNLCCSDGSTYTAVGGGGGGGAFDLNFAGDSGSGVITDAETFTITGGNGVVTTAAVNDLNIVLDLNATLDGVGLTTSLAGLEFTATNELALIQGCSNNEILKWVDAGATWDCAADQDTGSTINSFETWDAPAGTDPVASSGTDTMTLTQGVGILITGTAASDTLDFDFDYSNTITTSPGLGVEECVFSTGNAGAGLTAGAITCEGSVADGFEFRLLFPNVTGIDKTDVFVLNVESATLQNKTLNATNVIEAGAYDVASIDGDDINSNLAGDGLILTGATPDTLDLDLNATLDGVGSTSNLSGLEFTATAELALLQGCSNGEILKWVDAGATWDCAADSDSGAINSFETWATPEGTNLVADSSTDTVTFTGTGIDIVGTGATDTIAINFDSTEVFDTTWGGAGGAPTTTLTWTFDTDTPSDFQFAFTATTLMMSGTVQLDDGVGDSPAYEVINANNNSYRILAVNADDDLLITTSDSATQSARFRNSGAGDLNLDADGTLILGVPATSAIAGAGAHVAASIDGDDINSNLAGDGLILTAAAPDTLDVDLNATLDGAGLTSSLAGLEFTATAELALLQGCANGEILKWTDAGATWDCSADNSGGGGANSFETWNTPAGTNPVADSATDTINIESSGGILITGTAGTDTADFTLDLNATLDGVGLTSSLSGMEFTATSEVALLQGCADTEVLVWEDTGATWDCGAAAAATHDILSATHSDSLAAAVSRGSIIVGNATPAWSELVVGAAGTHLFSDGTDTAFVDSDTAAFILAQTASPSVDGGIVIDTDADNSSVIDDVLAFQSGGVDYHAPSLRTFPSSDSQLLGRSSVSNQYIWKSLTGGSVSVGGNPTNIVFQMATASTGAITDNTTGPASDGAMVIDTDGDGTNIIDDVLMFQEGGVDYMIPSVRTFPTNQLGVIALNTTTNQLLWKGLVSGEGMSVAGTDTSITFNMATAGVNAIQDQLGPPTAENSLVIDTTGDGVNILNDVLIFRSDSENFFIPAPREYPTIDGQVLAFNATNDDWEWIVPTTQLTQEEVEDFAGALVANATGTHTGIAITYQDGTGDMDFIVDHDGGINFVADEHVAHTGVVITAGTGLTGGGDISVSRTIDAAGGDGIIANANDLAVDLNATVDGLGLTSSLSGMEFTATAELALLQGCSNNEVLQWVEAASTWDCAAAAGGGTMSSFDITDTDASPILTVNDTEQIQFIGSTAITVVAAADGSNHDVTFSCDASTATTTGCLEQATQAEADAGTAGNLAVIASVLEAWNGGSNIATVGTIATGVWNGTQILDAFVSDTLTASLFVGSGSTTTAIDLATAEVAGILPDGNVADTLTIGASSTIAAGAYTAASIDGDDINANLAGNGLILTPASPDTLDIDLNATLDGVGLTTSLSGMEFTATSELALLQGCAAGEVLKWEDTGATWDCAADNDTGGAPALSSITDPVGDVVFTFDDGEEIDWVMTHTGPSGTDVFHIDFNQPDDADATDDIDVFMITMSLESGDPGDTIRAFKIVLNNGTANTVLDAAIQIINDETTAGTMTDAIRILSPGVDGGIVDAFDASAANIDNALSMGTNNIVTAATTIASTELDLLDAGIDITELNTGTKANLESILSDVADIAEADGDIYAGVHDFGTATSIEIKNAAAPTLTFQGEIAVDTTDIPIDDGQNQFIVRGDDHEMVLISVKTACFDIEDLVAGDDDFAIWSPPYAVTIRGAYCYCNGTCTVAGTVHFEKNRAGSVTDIGGTTPTGDVACSNSSAATEALTDLTAGTLTLASFDQLRFDTITAPTATNSMNICWTFTVDRQ